MCGDRFSKCYLWLNLFSGVCPAGSFRNATLNECFGCPLNFYQADNGKDSCNNCSIGEITMATNSTSMEDCVRKCPRNS